MATIAWSELSWLHWSVLYLASEWCIRIAMLVYVPERRSAAAARGWLLFIFLLPWPGLLGYALIGRPYVPRARRERMARAAELLARTSREQALQADAAHRKGAAGGLALEERWAPIARLAERLSGFAPVSGCRIELSTDYAQSVARLCADIDAAIERVELLYYIFASDSTGSAVAAALERAVRRGVRARVLVDSAGSKRWLPELVPRLVAAGVDVHAVLPVHYLRRGAARFDLRNHRKIALIDGRIGHVGSQNLVDADFKPGIVYSELVARVTGPVVADLAAVWLGDYFAETGVEPRVPGGAPAVELGGALVQALPSGPSTPSENNEQVIVSLVYAARRRVCMTTPYFVPDEPLREALSAAVRRGVAVHLVVSRQADQFLVCQAQRSYYEELLEAGVVLHEYLPGLLHAKHMSIDGEVALLGSSNFDIRSFALNAEICLLIYDREVVARLEAIETREFEASAVLALAAWRARSLGQRVLQNTARLADVLL